MSLSSTQEGCRPEPGSPSCGTAQQGARVARRGGCPASVAKDVPLREPPPPLPLPPAVPGPRQRKTKTRAEETAAGAPPEKPGQKARASRPRCPVAGGLAPPSGSVAPALAAPGPSGPLPSSLVRAPLPGAALPPTPCPARTRRSSRSGARGALTVCPRRCLPSGGAATPAQPPSPGLARPRPLRWPSALTWGGRGSGRGGIPTRQNATPFIGWQRRLCGRGTAGGASRDPGGAGPGRGRVQLPPHNPPPRPSSPPLELSTGRIRGLSSGSPEGEAG